jgi:hypothetical protein
MATANTHTPSSKKRTAKEAGLSDDLCEEFSCPITGRLPVDPVTAKDGRIYDRHALMLWFDKHPGDSVRSPVTGDAMGKDVTPAYQVNNTLKNLVDRGLLAGEAVDEWKAAHDEKAGFDAELKKHFVIAERGGKHSMAAIGFAYREGTNGAPVNYDKSLVWMRKAAEHGSVQGWASLGVAYVKGHGVPRNYTSGVMYLTHAASLGSEHGCVAIGYYLSKGEILERDIPMARHWYKKSLEASLKDAIDVSKQRRTEFFAEHGQE